MAASSDMSRIRALKDALYQALNAILSPDQSIRSNAEEQIKVLEVTDEFCVHLVALMVDGNAPLAIRQLASVLFKQFVECHWSSNSSKFRPPEPTTEIKAAVKAMLPLGLQESISKIRSSVAYAISAVAHSDWPEQWPQLTEILLQFLYSGEASAVHGVLRVLKEITGDVSDLQMPQFAPLLLPEMLKIFHQDQKYSIRTRGRAIEIFSTCAELISSMSAYNKTASSNIIQPILVPFCETLVVALKVPDGHTSDSGLKKEIINALGILLKFYPKQMIQWLPHILSPVWTSLTESLNIYIQTVVNMLEDENNLVDSDGEILGFESLVFTVFDFISILVESPKFKSHIQTGMEDLIYYMILYMQITEDQIRHWTQDPDEFIEDEDEDSYTYNVRISAQDLLMLLVQEFPHETSASLCNAATRHVQTVDKASNPHWWKVHESCLYALGSAKDLITQKLKKNELSFNIGGFMYEVVLENLTTSASPILSGRCMVFASQYATVMEEGLIKRFLEATVAGLQPSEHTLVRISAVRAVYGFCKNLKSAKHILMPYLNPIAEGLISLATQTSSELLILVMDTITVFVAIDDNFTAQLEHRFSPIVIAVFLKHNNDSVLVVVAQRLFQCLLKNSSARTALQQRLVPTLVSILQAQPTKVPSGLQAASLDILQSVVRNCPPPLPAPVINQGFPAAIHCTMTTDDNSVLQSGGECLRGYLSCAIEQVSNWRDESGRNGLEYITKVCLKLLDPKTCESASAFAGKLASSLLTCGALNERSSCDLLRAVLSKIQIVETFSVNQCLIMVFVCLAKYQIVPLLDFLSGVPGPTGEPALDFVMNFWCLCHSMFYTHERRMSSFALSVVLQYGLKENDQRLQSVLVRGDRIYQEGHYTRSKAKKSPEQWTTVPLFTKIYKLLVQELHHLQLGEQEENVEDSEGSEDEENDEDQNHAELGFACDDDYLSDIIDPEDEIDGDPDLSKDPVSHMDMKVHLTEFLKQLIHVPGLNDGLNPQEIQLLRDLQLVT